MFNLILVVCIGNICCLLIGECLLCIFLSGKKIDLVGIGVLIDYFVDESVIRVVLLYGILLKEYYVC